MRRMLFLLLFFGLILLVSCNAQYQDNNFFSSEQNTVPEIDNYPQNSIQNNDESHTLLTDSDTDHGTDEIIDSIENEESNIVVLEYPETSVSVKDAVSVASFAFGHNCIRSLHIPAIDLKTDNAELLNKKIFEDWIPYYNNYAKYGLCYQVNYAYQVFDLHEDVFGNFFPSREIIGIRVAARNSYVNPSNNHKYYMYYYFDSGFDREIVGKENYLLTLGIHPESFDKAVFKTQQFQEIKEKISMRQTTSFEINDVLITEDNTYICLKGHNEDYPLPEYNWALHEITIPTNNLLSYYGEIIIEDRIGNWWGEYFKDFHYNDQ